MWALGLGEDSGSDSASETFGRAVDGGWPAPVHTFKMYSKHLPTEKASAYDAQARCGRRAPRSLSSSYALGSGLALGPPMRSTLFDGA